MDKAKLLEEQAKELPTYKFEAEDDKALEASRLVEMAPDGQFTVKVDVTNYTGPESVVYFYNSTSKEDLAKTVVQHYENKVAEICKDYSNIFTRLRAEATAANGREALAKQTLQKILDTVHEQLTFKNLLTKWYKQMLSLIGK